MSSLRPFAALTLVFAAVALAEPRVNPHGAPDACGSCHAPAETGVGAPLPVVATCKGCHPTADMHPVGITPKKITVPPSFPLENGQVVCSTCHTEPAHGGTAAELPAPWFRGGPYARVTELCTTCHAPQAFTRTNPHTPREGPPGACSACHTRPPTPATPPEDAALRMRPAEVCGTCHADVQHAGIPEHMGRTVPPDLAARLPAAVPLANGQIACFSCHEVHDGQGAAHPASKLTMSVVQRARSHEWAEVPLTRAWPGESTENHLLALPLEGDALCGACHGTGPR